MPRTDVNFHPMSRNASGTPPQTFDMKTGSYQTFTPSGSNQQSAACPAGATSMVARIKTDTAVLISVGPSANALTDPIKAWVTDELIVAVEPGDKVALVLA